MAHMRLALTWEDGLVHHCDERVAPRLNLWRDIFPPPLERQVLDLPLGAPAEHRFAPGELVPAWRDRDCIRVPAHHFDRDDRGQGPLVPRLGRFYPAAVFRRLGRGGGGGDRRPVRLVEADGDLLRADFNHPLAERSLTLALTPLEIWESGTERGGRCNDVAELATADGPGMQARWRGQPTDFWSDDAFARRDPRPDPEFYRQPRLVDHLDRTAIAQIAGLYGRLIEPGARILDLMSSWHSHLPESLGAGRTVGLGLNAAELAANPVLGERVVQDLNARPELPFADGSFDAAVCTVSVEYLTRPWEVFREAARVLRPGGCLVATFSNRWFPTKAIAVWERLHEHERPALVLEYFLESGLYANLCTWSLRGLPRPPDDPYADRLAFSDPVFAVWGRRI